VFSLKTQIPKFGILTNPSIEITKDIKSILNSGFDFVEIGMEGPEGKPEVLLRKKRAILNLLKKFKLKSHIVHTSYWVDLGSDYEPVRKGWLEEFKKIIHVTHELGIKTVNLHSSSKGFYVDGKGKRITLGNWVKSLRELSKFAGRYNIEIILENVPRGGGISSAKDLKYILDKVPSVKLHLDVGHAFIHGGMDEVVDYIRIFKKRIAHVHWHDNHGDSDEHIPLGYGLIDHKRIAKEFKRIGYDGTITLEVFAGSTHGGKVSQNRILQKASRELLTRAWKKS
jgi:sugar phosphate isomerase/epimerase